MPWDFIQSIPYHENISSERMCFFSSWSAAHVLSMPPLDSRPFFEKVTIDLPNASEPLVILAPEAPTKPYIHSVKVNGEELMKPVLMHDQLVDGGVIEFVMSGQPRAWGSGTLFTKTGQKSESRKPHVHVEL